MQVVAFNVKTHSMLPEWDTYHAVVTPEKNVRAGTGPQHSTRFSVKLRLQRKPQYYIQQIFLVSYLILAGSLLPMGMPVEGTLGDRLVLHASGLLTLVAFKYSVTNDLPVVPYATYTSQFLSYQ